MGSVNYTKINFTLYELMHMIRRVELSNQIALTRMEEGNLIFPRLKKVIESVQSQSIHPLPSDQQIIETILLARNDSLASASEFGIHMTSSDITKCELVVTSHEVYIDNAPTEILTDDSDIDSEQNVQTAYINIENEDGTTNLMKKTELLWALTDSKGRLSSDRLKRVQEMSRVDNIKRRRLLPGEQYDETLVVQSSEIHIGEWCFFRLDGDEEVQLASDKDVMKYCVLGNILGFKCIGNDNEGKGARKRKAYRLDYASVSAKLSILSTWYTVGIDGTLSALKSDDHFFIDVKEYLVTLKNPFKEDFRLKSEDLAEINSSLVRLFT